MTRPRLILADDHPLLLEGLQHLLASEFDIVRSVTNGADLVRAVDELEADLLITDLSMPSLNGIKAIGQIRERIPGARILVLTMHDDPSHAREALAAGAMGYVAKTEASEELVIAIRTILSGRIYVSSSLSGRVGPAEQNQAQANSQAGLVLSTRQRQILKLLAQGRTTKEIAGELHISAKTVEYHKGRLLKVLNLETTAELIRFGTRFDLV